MSATATRARFGMLTDGQAVEAVTLANGGGVTARVISLGAALQALTAPDRVGDMADIVLGFDDVAGYAVNPAYFGVTVGRYANRIAGGRFALDGEVHVLARNAGSNALHGGERGFGRANWRVVATSGGETARVTLAHVSPDGDEGYPGTLTTTVTYMLDAANRLTIDYRATTTRPTVVNLTNHSYFNLAGAASGHDVLDHRLTVRAERFTPVGAAMIPTGARVPVAETPFDFRTPAVLGARVVVDDPQIAMGHGIDHNFVLAEDGAFCPYPAARLEDPASGRVLELSTTEPGLQVYTGNFLDGTIVGKGGCRHGRHAAIALEPQRFPDAPNQPHFPSARLDPGQIYRHRIVYALSVTP